MLTLEGLTVGEQVGEGSAGAVYRAQDTRTSEPVAVKVLNNQDVASLLDLKHEFRTVSDLRHPGLVRLDELIVKGTEAALTMEYVDGVHLDVYLCLAAQRDWELVRSAVRRLASAIHHLHEHDVLHADLKPSNVLCEESGRIVVLDFGFANLMQREGGARGGTPMYLSPERLLGGRAGPESDWWAVGVILAEALCGSELWPPSFGARVRAQREGPPQLPASLPSDIRQIVQGLLEPAPERRYGWRDISQLLGSADASPRVPFVGREDELSELNDVRHGVVRLRGPAGIGKSRLASEWLRRHEGVVLQSRCHPEEQIAFNAVDALVDGLAEELPRVWPEHRIGAALAVVFPVLKPFVGSESQAPSDPVECRRSAFAELGGLLHGLAERVSLALWIDDAQWADADSTALLRELITAGLAQRAVLAFGFRTSSTLSKSPTWLGTPDVDIILRPLEEAAAIALVASQPGVGLDDIRAAGGSPYLLTRLALDEANGDFDSLSEPAQNALFYISIAAPVRRVVLDSALGNPLSRADLGELEARRLVRRTGMAEVDIWHDRLTETIRSAYSDAELTAGHASIADVLLGMPEQDANALARHLKAAKRHDEAVCWRAPKSAEF